MTIRLPEPEPEGPIKDQMYRYRGEAVSVGGAVDWIIRRLDEEFVGSGQPTTARRWDAIKAHLRGHQLTDTLEPQLGAVAAYFKAREFAAHSRTVIAQVGESTQIFHLYHDGPIHNIKLLVEIQDLKDDAADTRAGYNAVQVVARALDSDEPEILKATSQLGKALLIGWA